MFSAYIYIPIYNLYPSLISYLYMILFVAEVLVVIKTP